jgi:type IV pilus assembly protein PilE
MIVVAIVAILATLATASYQESIRRARRNDAAAALVGLAAAMERYYAQRGSYTGAVIGSASGSIYPGAVPLTGGTAYYNLSFPDPPTATAYTLNASPTGAQTGDKCGTLVLNSAGAQNISGGASGVTAAQCWRR